jgi:exodeoxyribonuclease-5
MSYTLSQDQADALRAIGAWYRTPADKRTKPYLTLGGYAGTGKTTLIAYLRKALREFDAEATVAFCAYTGKASRVLQERLREQKVPRQKDSVSTIHSLIYTSTERPDGTPQWDLKSGLDRNLIIVDEASMVDEAIWRDLLSFNIPILAVGDHGQLPPVGSSFNLMADPELRLERIYRQAENSPIIEVATLARRSGLIPVKQFGAGVKKLNKADPEAGLELQNIMESWNAELLVLCGYNHTRVKLNQAIRSYRDATSPGPESGDQVVCLRNNRISKIYNGMTGHISSVRPADDDPEAKWYEIAIELDGEDYPFHGYALREQFGARETIKEVPVAPDGERGDLWDFGYALTVHKAQGSQATKVLVFEERFPKMTDEDWRRWLYTAVTRATDELIVIGDEPIV